MITKSGKSICATGRAGKIRALCVAGSLLLAMLAAEAGGQSADSSRGSSATPIRSPILADELSLVPVNGESVDRLRFEQLTAGVLPGATLLLRSASSLTARKKGDGSAWRLSSIAPQFLLVSNSTIPFSQNYGALWAGKGLSTRTLVGFRLESKRIRVIVAPEIIESSNSDWPLRHPGFYAPPPPPARSGGGYVFPYYIGPFSIDQPMRFGSRPIRRFDPGQSMISIFGAALEGGFSSENEWWGPGIRNAIVLSNNAPGFPHFFFRTAHQLNTALGGLEGRWLVGGLTESRYFDTVSTNNVRSLASIAATLQMKWNPNVSVGFARSVFATSSGWGNVPWRWFDVFASTPHYNRVPSDSTLTPGGRDQLYSLFARWVFPEDGLELYTEWGRTEFPTSLRDFLVAPNHTQGYTLGMQWRRPALSAGTVRVQAEATTIEQSATFRDRPIGSWYTSRRVVQGYTNRGEVLGASIGPGASSQWLGFDYMKSDWRIGAYVGRIRWNEDVHSTANFPEYVAYCIHDVSVYPGARAAKAGRSGFVSADISWQDRYNAFFQNGGGCPNNGPRVDLRNTTLSITLATFTHR